MALIASTNYLIIYLFVLLFGLCFSLLVSMIWEADYRNLNPFLVLINAFFLNYLVGDLISQVTITANKQEFHREINTYELTLKHETRNIKQWICVFCCFLVVCLLYIFSDIYIEFMLAFCFLIESALCLVYVVPYQTVGLMALEGHRALWPYKLNFRCHKRREQFFSEPVETVKPVTYEQLDQLENTE